MAAAVFATLVACGPVPLPPDPPVLAERSTDELLNPSPVHEIEIIHDGCFGPCPRYREKLVEDGRWEWETLPSDSAGSRLAGKQYPSAFSPLFIWLRDHPALYAASAKKVRCQDCEEIEFRFGLKSGKTIVVRYGLGFDGDDWWALSQLVEAAIRRETSRRAYTANETKPAI